MSLMGSLYSELYGIALVIFIITLFAIGIFAIKKIDDFTKKLDTENEEVKKGDKDG